MQDIYKYSNNWDENAYPKRQHLTLMRGDTHTFKFCRIDENDKPILTIADALYFTVKSNVNGKKVLFQKTINDMIFNSETGYYSFIIEPTDTDSLSSGKYVFDLEVIVDNYKQTISYGIVDIIPDVTRPIDEVSANGTNN